MAEPPRSVWLIEDNASLRRNVARVVDAVPGFCCTGLYHRCEDALGEVATGGSPMTPRVARRVLEMFTRLAPQPTAQPLSPRERQVIELMTDGLTNKEIATRLSLSVHPVVEYVGDIHRRLHVNTRAGAVAKALRSGWM